MRVAVCDLSPRPTESTSKEFEHSEAQVHQAAVARVLAVPRSAEPQKGEGFRLRVCSFGCGVRVNVLRSSTSHVLFLEAKPYETSEIGFQQPGRRFGVR